MEEIFQYYGVILAIAAVSIILCLPSLAILPHLLISINRKLNALLEQKNKEKDPDKVEQITKSESAPEFRTDSERK